MNQERVAKMAKQLLYNLCEVPCGWKEIAKVNANIFSSEADRMVFEEIKAQTEMPDFGGNVVGYQMIDNDGVYEYIEQDILPVINKDDSLTNNKKYIAHLKDARLRELEVEHCKRLIEIANNEDKGVGDRDAENERYEEIVANITTDDTYTETLSDIADEYLEYLTSKRNVLPTPFETLNRTCYGGFVGGQLICVGARPSRGKTEILNQMAEHQSTLGKHVLYFSLEMNKFEMFSRVMLSDGSVDSRELQEFNINSTTADFLRRFATIANNRYYHPIDTVRNVHNILSEIRRHHKIGQCDIAYIDYLGLVSSGKYDNVQRYREIAEMTHAFKAAAQTLNIPIVMAHQLNRDAGDDHLPNMSNLRESGDVEQDADIVLLVQSPSFCAEATEMWDTHIRLHLAKHRNGERGIIHLKHNGALKALTEEQDTIIKDKLKTEFL